MLKTKTCTYWKSGYCRNDKKCNFAHGNDELIVKNQKCLNGSLCYNENCIFIHPYDWNPFMNKTECIFCLKDKNSCNKNNKKYKHIDETINIDNPIIGKSHDEIDMLKKDYENDFPELLNIKKDYYQNINNEKSINEDNIPKITLTINGKQINNFDEHINLEEKFEIYKKEEKVKHLKYLNFKDTERKINESEIYNKVVSDKEFINNYSDTEDILNICENNIEIMIKYLTEHIDIIKNNFNELIIKTNDANFSNYCVNTQFLLNNIMSNALSLKTNYNDYKNILLIHQKKENISEKI
jgi:hypothetical protein